MTLADLQKFCVEILQEIHEFCVSNKIKYSLYAGSMLGAIRHKGFIPWDDDIDIIMPRSDYERFCRDFKSQRYELINCDNDSECFIAFTRVCDCKKTIIKTKSPWCSKKTGCWIDIFPADGFPSEPFLQEQLYKKCILLRRELQKNRGIKAALNGSFLHILRLMFLKIITLNGANASKIVKSLVATTKCYDYNECEYWASLTNVRNTKEWKHHAIETFKKCSLLPFEDYHFFVMDGYDVVLKQRYGDYMKLPPLEEQHPKQIYIKFYWK